MKWACLSRASGARFVRSSSGQVSSWAGKPTSSATAKASVAVGVMGRSISQKCFHNVDMFVSGCAVGSSSTTR